MKSWAILFAAAAGLFASRAARAQLPDLVSGSAQYMPGVPLEDPRPAEVQVTSYDAALNLPFPLGETVFLIPGLAYHVESLSFARAPEPFVALELFTPSRRRFFW